MTVNLLNKSFTFYFNKNVYPNQIEALHYLAHHRLSGAMQMQFSANGFISHRL
jgi:hypothetical protein